MRASSLTREIENYVRVAKLGHSPQLVVSETFAGLSHLHTGENNLNKQIISCSHLGGYLAQRVPFTLPLTCTVAKKKTPVGWPATGLENENEKTALQLVRCQENQEAEQQDGGGLSGAFRPQTGLSWPGCSWSCEDVRVVLQWDDTAAAIQSQFVH